MGASTEEYSGDSDGLSEGYLFEEFTTAVPNQNKVLILPDSLDIPVPQGLIPDDIEIVYTGHGLGHSLGPGVIGPNVHTVVLGMKYEFDIDDESIPRTVRNIYIHQRNRIYAPDDRPFYLYEIDGGGSLNEPLVGDCWTFQGSPEYFRISSNLKIWAKKAVPIGLVPDDENCDTEIDLLSKIARLEDQVSKFRAFKKAIVQALRKLD